MRVFRVWESYIGSYFFYLFIEGKEATWITEERGLHLLGFDENNFPIFQDYEMLPSCEYFEGMRIYDYFKP